uniref:Enoyl-[acyl-carrier-protein] reductase, mitochondrial n=1 Tax=Globodera pallida TaxID=36090 RepID=A0A183CLC4_GLOPA
MAWSPSFGIPMIANLYPIKPSLPAIGGNEGCARVEKVGSGVTELREGDVVLPANAGLGTWLTHGVYRAGQLFPLDESLKLDSISASMLQVNPSTAYRMLHDFIKLVPGDLIVQNGGNSSVGRFVIQMCRNLGFKSISVVRERPEINELKAELKALGADNVFTEEELAKELRSKIGAKLALNCVGGKSSLNLIRALADGGCMCPLLR